ncbi:unnamed protein product [Vicia faba]|uniref:BHLH domain-containing protein n=1 Tax=Vicia faba TaxID=3906 RepID=A0AAV1B057_VICFA|nr:unnamed protein product [Vicia faba]
MDLNSRYQELQQNQRFPSSGATSSMLVGSSMGMDQPSSFSSAHFSNNTISFQNDYATMKGVENYDGVNNSSEGGLTLSMNILKNQIGFSQSSSSLGILSHNSKMRSDGHKFLYGYNDQNVEVGNQVNTLSHHMSLPRKSSEMFVMENLHQFPDSSVPSSIRAKRGCATHPRSVAERVRRTRISEGMKKLQELVPNTDKQTCTSEMLELAVTYIKDLQKQLKIMSAKRAKCRCKNLK